MSGLSEERERDDIQQGVSKPLEPELNLFKPKGVTIRENWQCIYCIAPTNKKKDWKASNRIGVYCIMFKCTISKGSKIQKHMNII